MGEIQQMIYAEGYAKGYAEGLTQAAVKMVNWMLKRNIPIEEIKKDLNEDFSSEIVKEALSQVNLVT